MNPILIFTAIKTFVTKNKRLTAFMTGIIIALILFFFIKAKINQIDRLKEQVAVEKNRADVAEYNQKALVDTVKMYKMKDGTNVYERSILIGNIDDLKKLNADLAAGFKKLLGDDSKKSEFISYLTTKITSTDSIVAMLNRTKPTTGNTGSYVQNDSTIAVNEIKKYDDRNYRSLTGSIKIHLDSNKIKTSDINLLQSFGIGLDIATYLNDKKEVKLKIGTQMPDLKIDVNGAADIEKILNRKPKPVSTFSLRPSVQLGYGYSVMNSKLTPSFYGGVGLSLSLNKLPFSKK